MMYSPQWAAERREAMRRERLARRAAYVLGALLVALIAGLAAV